MLALSETEALELAAGLLGFVTALIALGAVLTGSSRVRRKRLSYAVFIPSFSPRNGEETQLLFALQNTGRQDLDRDDLRELEIVFPDEAPGGRINSAHIHLREPPGLRVCVLEPKDGGYMVRMAGMNRGELLVLQLSVSGFAGTPPVVNAWMKSGRIAELPVEFSARARVSGIGLGATGIAAMVYAAWERFELLIGVGFAALVVGAVIHGWARRKARLRRERILGGPVP